MKQKNSLTAEQIYKKNQNNSKLLRNLAPYCFWALLFLGVLCLYFAIKNSFGNVAEIIQLLDTKKFTGEQLSQNYDFLINKYGEWVIGTGGNGFTITFINISKALFSGVAVANFILSITFFIYSYVLGKWLLPKIASQLILDNQDMVNLYVLKNVKEK